ncbi:MAG: hypothetical protein ACRC78_06485 [Planktothrix sp.]
MNALSMTVLFIMLLASGISPYIGTKIMATKKEPRDPRHFCLVRDAFWALKYPQDPNYDHKDWAIAKTTKTRKLK